MAILRPRVPRENDPDKPCAVRLFHWKLRYFGMQAECPDKLHQDGNGDADGVGDRDEDGLGWTGPGLGWAGRLDSAGLGWIGLARLDWAGLGWLGRLAGSILKKS